MYAAIQTKDKPTHRADNKKHFYLSYWLTGIYQPTFIDVAINNINQLITQQDITF